MTRLGIPRLLLAVFVASCAGSSTIGPSERSPSSPVLGATATGGEIRLVLPVEHTSNEMVPLEDVVFVPCTGPGEGEFVAIRGDLHVGAHSSIIDDALHVQIEVNAQGLTGTGQTTGRSSLVVGASLSDLTIGSAVLPLQIESEHSLSGNIVKFGGIPPFRDTPDYVPKAVVLVHIAASGLISFGPARIARIECGEDRH